ncbi:MAG TPA: Wzz/FepE/Etk N-terminal domain-containing protein [Candidatus Krumholzibacteria bacterium]|nr:Wzz/FepE/Etk N-terminal domain-containing protein [Candidatus Krumholzibacteria bacterium]
MTDQRIDTRQETSVRDFLDVVFRRKWVIISMVVVTTLLVFAIDAQRPDMWESTSRVMVKRGRQQSILTTNVYILPWAEDVASVVQLILSEDVFAKARVAFADSVKTGRYPKDWVFNAGSVHSGVVGESNVFTISYSDSRPDVCRLGCNVATDAFREFYRENNAPPPVSDYFVNQLNDTRAELAQAREERNRFMNSNKFFGADETSRFLLNKIGGLEVNLSQLEGDVSSQKLRTDNLAMLTEKSGAELEKELSFSVSQHVLQSAVVQNIKFNLQQLNMTKEGLTQKYTDKHPDVISVNAQIAELHENLKEEVENAYKVEKGSLEEARAKRDAVFQELSKAKQELATVPDHERQLAEIDNNIAVLETSEKNLVQQQTSAQITAVGSPEEDVTILSRASNPYSKKTRDYVRLALGPLLSIIVGLGIAFFLESMDHSVKNRAEAEEYLRVPVLATVADTGQARRRKIASGE